MDLVGNTFRSMLRLTVSANAVPSSLIRVTVTMETIHASESSALRRATRRNFQEDCVLQAVYSLSHLFWKILWSVLTKNYLS
jgi:hypothetical protein